MMKKIQMMKNLQINKEENIHTKETLEYQEKKEIYQVMMNKIDIKKLQMIIQMKVKVKTQMKKKV